MKNAKKLLYSQKIAPYVFVVPFVLSLLIFWLYPLVSGISHEFPGRIVRRNEMGGGQAFLKSYWEIRCSGLPLETVWNIWC